MKYFMTEKVAEIIGVKNSPYVIVFRPIKETRSSGVVSVESNELQDYQCPDLVYAIKEYL